jgi:hypothetical protein
MKQNKHTTFTGTRTTSADVCRWVQTLLRLHERLAPRFARPEPRRRVLVLMDNMNDRWWEIILAAFSRFTLREIDPFKVAGAFLR